ncbi:MAG: lysophospholipid acyltransferase family protein [Acidobacteriota bacterium]
MALLKIDPESRFGSALLTLLGYALRTLLLSISATLRYEVVSGSERLREIQASREAKVLTFWHDQIFLAVPFLYRDLHRRGLPVTILASLSRDGEMMTRMLRPFGVDIVRGSASRGGLEALRSIHDAVKRRGSSPILTPDGPHGPVHEFKLGVALLAQMTGAPVLPLGFAATRAWRINSWDRLFVPKPFSRVCVVVGDPKELPGRIRSAQLEEERQRLERELIEVAEKAQRATSAERR